jgi:hypothetical protein
MATPSGATISRQTFQHIPGHRFPTYHRPTGGHRAKTYVRNRNSREGWRLVVTAMLSASGWRWASVAIVGTSNHISHADAMSRS